MFQLSDFQFQAIAFILEFIGLSLAFIEVRLPGTAQKIARFLAKLASPIQELRKAKESGSKAYESLAGGLGKLLNTVLTIGTIPLVILFVFNAIEAASAGTLTVSWLVPQFISFIIQIVVVTLCLILLSIILYFTVAGGSDFATRFVEGRAVGTLGIMLATIGVMMELYQLVTVV